MSAWKAFPLAMTALLLTACAGPSYYWQAASGHTSLMRSRQDIDAYLDTADAGDELAARLLETRRILEFAELELGLSPGDSYQSFVDSPEDAVVWNVVAAPEFSLRARRWCFLVAGCVPYRGYFDPARADKEAARLAAKGYDTSVSGAIAYSSLGWFDDPVMASMLALSDARLAATLFHELAHQRLYLKGETTFNESWASFVEQVGVEAWLGSTDMPDELRHWSFQLAAGRQFRDLLMDGRGRLEQIYRSGLPEQEMRERKKQVFRELRASHDEMAEQEWGGQALFAGWFQRQPNNASLALVNSYLGGLCAFQALFRQADGDIESFFGLVDSLAQGPREARDQWLQTSC